MEIEIIIASRCRNASFNEIGKGLYYEQKTGKQIEFEDVITVDEQAWETAAQLLTHTATLVEKNISLNLSNVSQIETRQK